MMRVLGRRVPEAGPARATQSASSVTNTLDARQYFAADHHLGVRREDRSDARPAAMRAGHFSVSTEGSTTMLRCLIRVAKKIIKTVTRAATAVAKWIAQCLRRAWKSHGDRVATDAVYAAVTATLLAGLLGLIPVTDVLAAVLSAVFGVHMTSRHGHSRDVNRWNEDWDLA